MNGILWLKGIWLRLLGFISSKSKVAKKFCFSFKKTIIIKEKLVYLNRNQLIAKNLKLVFDSSAGLRINPKEGSILKLSVYEAKPYC